MRDAHVYVNAAKQYLILWNLFLPVFRHLMVPSSTHLADTTLNQVSLFGYVYDWKLIGLLALKALIKTLQFTKHLSVLSAIPSWEGEQNIYGHERLISIVRCF